MGLSLGYRLAPHQKLSPAQQLSQQIALRLELIRVLHGDEYRPSAVCPDCERDLTIVEILQGFSRDPADFTTQCPKCSKRFHAQLRSGGANNSVSVLLYCDIQTQAQLGKYAELGPAAFLKENASVFHSAIFHNGSLRAAFARLSIPYKHEEITDPLARVVPFLGKMPDALIARITGISLNILRCERQRLRINSFRRRVDD